VNVFKISQEMLSLTGRKNAALVNGTGELYEMLLAFRARLEASIHPEWGAGSFKNESGINGACQ
jgi:hypothetical protein